MGGKGEATLITHRSGTTSTIAHKLPAATLNALSADKEYSSSDPAIRAAKPTITEILIGY